MHQTKHLTITSRGEVQGHCVAHAFPRSHQICRFNLESELDPAQSLNYTEVTVTNRSTGKSFQKKIPSEYHFHLGWIEQESTEGSRRSKWLQNVMDHLAEELDKAPLDLQPSWRSASLNALLVREFHGVMDSDGAELQKRAATLVGVPGETLTPQNWEHFYFGVDVISGNYKDRWKDTKPQPPGNLAIASTAKEVEEQDPSTSRFPHL